MSPQQEKFNRYMETWNNSSMRGTYRQPDPVRFACATWHWFY